MIRMLDRLLLFVYSLAIGIVSVVAIVLASGGFDEGKIGRYIGEVAGESVPAQATTIGVAIALLLISLRFFVVSVRRGGNSAPSINQRTEHGDIRISVETVENLALKAASRTRGVKDLKARVRVSEAGLAIMIRAFVDGEGSIPGLSEEMQKAVSQQIEETTGIPVSEVSVFIANVSASQASFKSRVE